MPAALDVNREAVRVMCQEYGVRETARRMGLPESTVKSWCTRGEWLKAPVQPPTVLVASNASKPHEAMQAALADDSRATRAALQATARIGSEYFAEEARKTPGLVMDRAKNFQQLTSAAGMIGGWGERGQDQAGDMLILSIGGNVNLGGQHVHQDKERD